MLYSLVSTVISDSDDRRQLRQGTRLLAEIAHNHGIPITWAVDGASASAFAGALTQWHESHGDELLLMLDITPIWETEADLNDPLQAAEHIVTSREKLPDYISSEWRKVERAMPWATPIVAGAEWKHHVLLHALDQVEFKGLWGYRWDNGDDRGCPFGFFYPSAAQHNFSGHPASPIVGVPYDAIEFTRHRTKGKAAPDEETQPPTGPATLLLDLFNGNAQQTLDCYLANLQWNSWLGYVQYINAEALTLITPERLEGLEAYFAYLRGQAELEVVRLSEAINRYQSEIEQTQPTFMLLENSEAQLTLCYYDAACQLIFESDKIEPTEMKNYLTPPAESRHGVEFNLPQIETFLPARSRNQLSLQFVLESTKAMPYGFAVWGNHAGLTLAKSNADAVTWVGERLLFIRVNLAAGKNEIEVVLTI
jgi:hypothetical protein